MNERDAPPRVCDLIGAISAVSDRYGNRLLDFMERYGLHSLAQATEEQLREYVTKEGISWKNGLNAEA